MTVTLDLINYSEFATLAACETKWGYGYVLREEEQGERKGLHLGTLLHLGADRWLRGKGANLPLSWTDDINTGGKPGEERTLFLTDFDDELVDRARWLLARYEAYYGATPPSDWEVVSSEEWLKGELDNDTVLVGRTDGIIRVDGKLWLREVKSYGSKQRLASVHVEPQPSIYYELIRQNYGEFPVGILYDGIYTYRWVLKQRTLKEIEAELAERAAAQQLPVTAADLKLAAKQIQGKEPGIERPVGESFDRVWPDRTPDQVEQHLHLVRNAVRRRNQLALAVAVDGIDALIPNVGNACQSCGFKAKCWAHLTGDDGDIEFADDEPTELSWEG